MNTVCNWAKKQQMEFNVSKCKTVHNGKKNICHKYTMNGQPVEEVAKEKDLGVVFTKKLNTRTYTHTHTHTHNCFTALWLDFVRDNLGEPVPEETFTHSNLSWSSIVPCLLHPSTMIHGILPVQSTVFFHNLSPSFVRSTSWPGTLHFILHTFLHPIIVFFSQHTPILSQPVSL